jgi:hypothetical protein
LAVDFFSCRTNSYLQPPSRYKQEIEDPNIAQYVTTLVQLEMQAMKGEGIGPHGSAEKEDEYIASRLSSLGSYPELKFASSVALQVH